MGKKFVFETKKPGRSILWPCLIPVPIDGDIDQQELSVRFSLDHADEDDHVALITEAQAAADFVRHILDKVVLGFDAVPNEAGETVGNDDMFAVMWATPYIQNGVLGGYLAMREGRLPKNFVRPSASTSAATTAGTA